MANLTTEQLATLQADIDDVKAAAIADTAALAAVAADQAQLATDQATQATTAATVQTVDAKLLTDVQSFLAPSTPA